MLESLLPLIGGGLFGALVKLMSLKMQMRNEEQLMLFNVLSKKKELIADANNIAIKSKGFAWTRRFIVISIVLLVISAFFIPLFDNNLIINVQQEIESGNSYLFGLVDTTNINKEWIKLKGSIILPEIGYTFQAIVGTYFGASIANR